MIYRSKDGKKERVLETLEVQMVRYYGDYSDVSRGKRKEVSEVQQRLINVVLRIQKAPLQGFEKSVTLLGEDLPVPPSVPAESVLGVFCNGKVNLAAEQTTLRFIRWFDQSKIFQSEPLTLTE